MAKSVPLVPLELKRGERLEGGQGLHVMGSYACDGRGQVGGLMGREQVRVLSDVGERLVSFSGAVVPRDLEKGPRHPRPIPLANGVGIAYTLLQESGAASKQAPPEGDHDGPQIQHRWPMP